MLQYRPWSDQEVFDLPDSSVLDQHRGPAATNKQNTIAPLFIVSRGPVG